jgi:hypothetical protein
MPIIFKPCSPSRPASLPSRARLAPLSSPPRSPPLARFDPAPGPPRSPPPPARLAGPPLSPPLARLAPLPPFQRLIPAPRCTGIPGPAHCLTSSQLSSLPCTAPHPGQSPSRGSVSPRLHALLAPRPALPQPQPRRLSPRPRAFGLNKTLPDPRALGREKGFGRLASLQLSPSSCPPRSPSLARLAHLPRPASLISPGPPRSPPPARLAPIPWPASQPFQACLAPLPGPPRSPFRPASLSSSPCQPRWPASLPAPGPPRSPPPARLAPYYIDVRLSLLLFHVD